MMGIYFDEFLSLTNNKSTLQNYFQKIFIIDNFY